MQISFNPINLAYLEYLFEHYRDDNILAEEVEDIKPIIKFMSFRIDTGFNILHLF